MEEQTGLAQFDTKSGYWYNFAVLGKKYKAKSNTPQCLYVHSTGF